MSAYTMAKAFAPIEARYHAQIMAETWGHLAPEENKTYRGHVVFSIGCFGSDYLNPTILTCEFKAKDRQLDDSPWFYDALADFLQDGQGIAKQRYPIGSVWRFDGSFKNYKFNGSMRRLL